MQLVTKGEAGDELQGIREGSCSTMFFLASQSGAWSHFVQVQEARIVVCCVMSAVRAASGRRGLPFLLPAAGLGCELLHLNS